MTFFLLRNRKEDILKKVSTVFVHAIKVIKVWNNIWLIKWWQNIDFWKNYSGANNLKNSTRVVIL